MNNYMTVVEKTSERIRSNVIIYSNFYHFAEMSTMDQLEKFSKTLGFTYTFLLPYRPLRLLPLLLRFWRDIQRQQGL